MGLLIMGSDNNKYNTPERQVTNRRELVERRKLTDRRDTTRFSDVLGRRSGIERRLPIRPDH
jgi:hypothetical protein